MITEGNPLLECGLIEVSEGVVSSPEEQWSENKMFVLVVQELTLTNPSEVIIS